MYLLKRDHFQFHRHESIFLPLSHYSLQLYLYFASYSLLPIAQSLSTNLSELFDLKAFKVLNIKKMNSEISCP